VTVEDFEVFDIIFAMDSSNHSNLIQRAPDESAKNKVRLLLNEAYPGENRQVPDPYTGGQEGFSHVYELLEEAIQSFLRAH
jgi:protein-tyrosine phosphatase